MKIKYQHKAMTLKALLALKPLRREKVVSKKVVRAIGKDIQDALLHPSPAHPFVLTSGHRIVQGSHRLAAAECAMKNGTLSEESLVPVLILPKGTELKGLGYSISCKCRKTKPKLKGKNV